MDSNDSVDFSIKKISSYEDSNYKLPHDDLLFKHCFRTFLTGSSGAGKSNLIANLLLREEFGFDSFFTEIFIFSNTAMNDDVYQDVIGNIISEENIIDSVEEMPFVIQNIIDKQRELKNKIQLFHEERGTPEQSRDFMPKILLIFDDMASEQLIKTKQFKQLFFKSRHNNISLMVLMQYFHLLPKDCRQNCSNFIIFEIQTAEIKSICEQLCPSILTYKKFQRLIEHATAKPFNFLHINNRLPKDQRFFRNFENQIKIT